jgi:hypothetical protein
MVYHMYVNDLLLDGYKAWDNIKICNLFTSSCVNDIIEVSLFTSMHEDKLVWMLFC